MKIGGKYRLVQIGLHSFRELAHELKLDADAWKAISPKWPPRFPTTRQRSSSSSVAPVSRARH